MQKHNHCNSFLPIALQGHLCTAPLPAELGHGEERYSRGKGVGEGVGGGVQGGILSTSESAHMRRAPRRTAGETLQSCELLARVLN